MTRGRNPPNAGVPRNAHGHWLPGPDNPGGPGRPPSPLKMDLDAAREYHNLFRIHCPPEKYAKIIQNAVAMAEKGDVAARQWLGSYVIPDPARLMEGAAASGLTINLLITDFVPGAEPTVRELAPPAIDAEAETLPPDKPEPPK